MINEIHLRASIDEIASVIKEQVTSVLPAVRSNISDGTSGILTENADSRKNNTINVNENTVPPTVSNLNSANDNLNDQSDNVPSSSQSLEILQSTSESFAATVKYPASASCVETSVPPETISIDSTSAAIHDKNTIADGFSKNVSRVTENSKCDVAAVNSPAFVLPKSNIVDSQEHFTIYTNSLNASDITLKSSSRDDENPSWSDESRLNILSQPFTSIKSGFNSISDTGNNTIGLLNADSQYEAVDAKSMYIDTNTLPKREYNHLEHESLISPEVSKTTSPTSNEISPDTNAEATNDFVKDIGSVKSVNHLSVELFPTDTNAGAIGSVGDRRFIANAKLETSLQSNLFKTVSLPNSSTPTHLTEASLSASKVRSISQDREGSTTSYTAKHNSHSSSIDNNAYVDLTTVVMDGSELEIQDLIERLDKEERVARRTFQQRIQKHQSIQVIKMFQIYSLQFIYSLKLLFIGEL